MAGTLAVTSSQPQAGVVMFSLDWLSTAGGAVSGNNFDLISGEILHVIFTPDSGGTQPSDLYDVTLIDAGSDDVLEGVGANLSNAAKSARTPEVDNNRRYIVAGSYDLVVANAGNAKGGLVELLIWRC